MLTDSGLLALAFDDTGAQSSSTTKEED